MEQVISSLPQEAHLFLLAFSELLSYATGILYFLNMLTVYHSCIVALTAL